MECTTGVVGYILPYRGEDTRCIMYYLCGVFHQCREYVCGCIPGVWGGYT